MTDFDSSDWVDDTCDGCIGVEVIHKGNPELHITSNTARVIGTTPKFVSGIYAPTSLYDLMEEVYERSSREQHVKEDKPYNFDKGNTLEWYKDIWPLLQRAPLLSWVSVLADGGHGPHAAGHFCDPKWTDALSDPDEKNKPLRKAVLGRIRLPATNDKYSDARAGQAYPYFMPLLSGDNGRTTNGDPSTFSSLTELQYDRLVKWSEGKFRKGVPLLYPSTIEEVPLQGQPAALTKAALEPTIGAPLYPGIEMSWNAESSSLYDLSMPFTISKDVLPGDLTKYLSLPWQSDFYMCRSYWWPSVRPDTIVEESSYNYYKDQLGPGKKVDPKSSFDRVPWERGLHQNYTDQYGDQPYFANTDMAQRWHELGFIVQKDSAGPGPIFVETQRSLSNATPLVYSPKTGLPHGGSIVLPSPDTPQEPIITIDSLQAHLKTAMAVELSTIPLYLFAMYTVQIPKAFENDPRYYDPVIGAVRGVVAEEMLHLSLAGNLLLAVGGNPKLYDPDIIPSYPMYMPGRVPQLKLQLRKMTKKNLQTFIDVEMPEAAGAKGEPDEYHTLGQFYEAIKQGLNYLDGNGGLFDSKTAPYQFSPGVGYQPKIRDAGGSVVVTDIKTALEAIDIIVDQGEGNPGPYADLDHLELDHYARFLKLQQDTNTWDVYPARQNPKTSGYFYEDIQIYYVSLTFDAAYCYLLKTIEKLWKISADDDRQKLVLRTMYGIMMGILAPLAKFLVQQPIGEQGEVAAPCFGYYFFDESKSALGQLQDEMRAAIQAYVKVTDETPDQVAINNYGPQLEQLLPIQQTIDGLLDIEKF